MRIRKILSINNDFKYFYSSQHWFGKKLADGMRHQLLFYYFASISAEGTIIWLVKEASTFDYKFNFGFGGRISNSSPSPSLFRCLLFFMRLILIFSALTLASFANGQTKKIAKIRYDGFYRSVSDIYSEHLDTVYNNLRFYPDGKVISVTSEATAYDLKKWFNLTMDNPSIGKYEVHGKKLYFSTTSKEGTVIYKGKINDQYYLFLKLKSLINHHKELRKYYFTEIPSLK